MLDPQEIKEEDIAPMSEQLVTSSSQTASNRHLSTDWIQEFQKQASQCSFSPAQKRVGYIFHPELVASADRLPSNLNRSTIVHQLVHAYGLSNCFEIIEPEPATKEALLEFHSKDYVDFILRAEHLDEASPEYQAGIQEFGLLHDCPVFSGMACYVSWIAGGSISAAKALRRGEKDIVLAWDGGRHHSKRSEAAGFCYINDIVLAIFELHKTFDRVMYIDIDIHHGDGVQSAFEFSPRVMTISFHRFENGFFPGTGSLGDVGFGKGLYTTVNVPLKAGLQSDRFLDIFKQVVDKAMDKYDPKAIVIQCGADGLAGDPLGGKWNLTVKSIGQALKHILNKQVPTLCLGGGGYSPTLSARCWAYCTAIALDMDSILPHDIPEHDYFTEYGPNYTIWNETSLIQDRNEIGSFSERLVEEITDLLENLNATSIGKVD